MFSRFFILRPVLSTVIALIILLAGITAMMTSPIEQYPNITPPCISVTAVFPGANSEAIANAVAAPIEDNMSGVEHMIYMQSSSANGNSTYTLNIYFDVGTDLNAVEADVLNRISTAMPVLPYQVQQQGITLRQINPDLFLVIPFYSDTGAPDELFISNYVQRYIYPLIEQIPGIGVVNYQGQRAYAMRALLDTNKMSYYQVSTKDIVDSVLDQNAQYAIGQNAMAPMSGDQKYNFVINPPGYYQNISQLKKTVIRATQNGVQVVKLEDVADIKLDAEAYTSYFYFLKKGADPQFEPKFATALQLYLTPDANQIAVKNAVVQVLKDTEKFMPKGMKYYIHYDSSGFVLDSVKAVISTLLTAFALVFIVIVLFIQNFRGTIIPVLAIPVSIVGTFAFIYLFGFSINTMTLFGMVLAVGIVVDDAIIVLESVDRIMKETGMNSTDAAIATMKEVAAPIIAIVLVLNAVFVPVAFLGGFTGVLMKQFGLTIAVSVTLSGIVALTLTPMLCGLLMKNSPEEKKKNRFFQTFDNGLEHVRSGYLRVVTWTMNNMRLAWLSWLALCLGLVFMFFTVPTSLMPLEDMGYFYSKIQVTSAGSINYLITQSQKIAKAIMDLPYVEKVAILFTDVADNSTNKTNTATLSVILKPSDQRPGKHHSIDDAIAAVNTINAQNKDIQSLTFNQPPIRGMSPTGGVTFYLQARQPNDVKKIYKDSVALNQYLKAHYPSVLSAEQFYDVDTPELYVDVDAQKTYLYGVTYADIFYALQAAYGNYYINYFTMWNDVYWVILQGDYRFRNAPERLDTIYAKAKDGSMVPLGSLVSFKYKTGPEVVTRINDFLASQIVVNPNTKAGYTEGDVMKAILDATPKVLGNQYSVTWFGPSYQEALAGNQSVIACSLGILMVFLILCGLYELWLLPSVVILVLPCALFGALLALFLLRMSNDLYFQISLLTLIGLSAKNAILIIEYALDKFKEDNVSLIEAAVYAAKVRFRPILMTSLAFIFGSVSLVVADGAGANAQHSVGTGIIGGMIGSTVLATLFVPLFFVCVMKKSKLVANKGKEIKK
jgi:multidrug efflux pump